MNRISLFVFTCFIFLSCNPQPDLTVQPYTPTLVIDGSIEENDFARVVLSYSASYFSDIDSTSIRELLVTTAKVTVTDGEEEEVLTLKRDKNFFPPYVYQGTSLRGKVGKVYKLQVLLKGQTYTASTTIPPAASFDKLWFELAPGKDSLGYIYGQFTDNPDTENFYRIFTKREHVDTRYIPVYLSAVGDQYFNGKTFTFSILRGPDDFTNVIDDLYFKKGDTVSIKFCTMDKAHFDFWRTVERELYVVGNPFSSSGNEILSNIDDHKALGVWGGYGVNYFEIVAK